MQQTHTQQIKASAAAQVQKVLAFLDWTEEQLFNFIHTTGCSYLQHYIPTDPAGIDELIESKAFWAWWKNHWFSRDKQFCINAVHQLSINHKRFLYESLHNPEQLSKEIYPNSIVLGRSYVKMIADVIENVHTPTL
jgi:phosphoribosylanthranilate isomerase